MNHRIILGHLLGDGHLAKNPEGNSYFAIHRKAEHHSMNLWTKDMLQKEGLTFSDTYPKLCESGGKSFPSSYLRSGRSEFWSELRELWYPNGVKKIPEEYLFENFDELAFTLWFADDGEKAGRISTDSFTREDVELLKSVVKDRFGIRLGTYHQSGRDNHLVLYVSKDDRKILNHTFRNQVGVPELYYKFQ